MNEEGFLLCFSLKRNWKRLTSYASESDPRIERLKSLNGIRNCHVKSEKKHLKKHKKKNI
ncbi:unnamed protein product [Danaus chrysippus]|uniref:(African queen) hypothetical protein n=1 Tax=Danaus chrysippus TaxID=151541 RepID=A0A8J2VTD8_9NEOP|nr:unnamed protein product [Danaus chrysippus]